MKVGFYQFDVEFGKKENNLKKVIDKLETVDFDLIVLPELFNTGYLFTSKEQLFEIAEKIPTGKTTEALLEVARHRNGYIVAGLAEIEEEKIYNTTVIVGPEGYIGKHRKVHLSRFEENFFDSGNFFEVFDIGGVEIGIVTCFDSWFPESARLLSMKGAKILCHPSNFGGIDSLDVIRIRALENMVYTITANRIGTEYGKDFDAAFRGESRIVSYDGSILVGADSSESINIIEIDPELAAKKSNHLCADLFKELSIYEKMQFDKHPGGNTYYDNF